jgi:hypothetical protein
MDPRTTQLDPFRVILGWLEARGDSDLLRRVANTAGLVFDSQLDQEKDDNYSSTYRARAQQRWIRTLVPRVLSAYEHLGEEVRLAVARAAVETLGAPEDLARSLSRVGWGVQGGELVVGTPEVREMFFPKGSQWDAFGALKDFFAAAARELTVVDPYADGTVFELLGARPTGVELLVRVLCFDKPDVIASEAKRFRLQYPGAAIQIRRAKEFHDRFLVLDGQECIHVGASLNHAGRTGFMISRLEDAAIRNAVLATIAASWAGAAEVP